MHLVNPLPVYIFVNLFITCVTCGLSVKEMLQILGDKMSALKEQIPFVCTFTECCNEGSFSPDINKFDDMLRNELYGQQIAHSIVVNALHGHLRSPDTPKALTMSFHGPPGTGKTYVAQLMAKFFHKRGINSQFYHYFNGRNDFPLQKDVELYKEELRKTIINSLTRCERSIFVFDEVDKMPEGLLDVLVPFLDYHSWLNLWRYSSLSVNTNKAVYIFLSNTGSSKITQRLLSHWQQGKHRDQVKHQDFENLISNGAFNERGGFYHSETIDTSVIDHYVPFLPLEEEHVKNCLKRFFLNRGITPTDDMIQEGLSYVTFGPSPHKIYATAGCKRLEQKVAAIIYSKRKNEEL